MDKTEEELKTEYINFIKTDKGKEWLEFWHNNMKSDLAGDFGDYLYDFYPEMISQEGEYYEENKNYQCISCLWQDICF